MIWCLYIPTLCKVNSEKHYLFPLFVAITFHALMGDSLFSSWLLRKCLQRKVLKGLISVGKSSQRESGSGKKSESFLKFPIFYIPLYPRSVIFLHFQVNLMVGTIWITINVLRRIVMIKIIKHQLKNVICTMLVPVI